MIRIKDKEFVLEQNGLFIQKQREKSKQSMAEITYTNIYK